MFADPAFSQSPGHPSKNFDLVDLNRRVAYFYKSGHIDDIPRILTRWLAAGGPTPQLLGFIVGVSAKNPTQIDRMFPPSLNDAGQRYAVVGVRVAISTDRAEALARRYGWPQSRLRMINAGTTIDKYPIRVPQDIDMLWGASFATGDPQYPKRILMYYVSVADRGDVAIDEIYGLIRGTPNYNKNNVQELRQRYGMPKLGEILTASAALWSLTSNAAQHSFVKNVVDAHITSYPDTQSAVGLKTVGAVRAATKKDTERR